MGLTILTATVMNMIINFEIENGLYLLPLIEQLSIKQAFNLTQ